MCLHLNVGVPKWGTKEMDITYCSTRVKVPKTKLAPSKTRGKKHLVVVRLDSDGNLKAGYRLKRNVVTRKLLNLKY